MQIIALYVHSEKLKKSVDIWFFMLYYIEVVDEAWLSLVERYIRDVEVASSNLVASMTYKRCWKC